MIIESQRRRPWFYILAGLAAILYFAPSFRVLSHERDEGTLIIGAVRVIEGQLPYRDFFEVMGPISFYWLALFFKILGTTWQATRICVLITTTATVVLLIFLARRLDSRHAVAPVIVYVAACFQSWNTVTHHMNSNLAAFASFAIFASYLDQPNPFKLFICGAVTAVTAWIMLPKGLLLLASFVPVLWTQRRTRPLVSKVATLIGGFAVFSAAFLCAYWLEGGLADLLYANWVWPLKHYSKVNSVPYGWHIQHYWWAFQSPTEPVFSQTPGFVVGTAFIIPLLVIIALPLILAGCAARFRRAAFDRITLPYWLTGTALWLSEIHRADIIHIVYGSPLFILLAFYYIRRSDAVWATRGIVIVNVCASLLLLMVPLLSSLVARYPYRTRRGIIYDSAPRDPVLEYLNSHVAPNEPIFVYPYSPIYYFLSGAKNPTRYSILMYDINTNDQFREAVRTLEVAKVRYVVVDRSFMKFSETAFPAYHLPPPEQLIMEPYLKEQYRPVDSPNKDFQILKRKEVIGATEWKSQ
ncbi:MAG TPA: hypothetical protein VGL72_20555 [Bryobacteraceae bacterium]|jgi:hypothetical protein